MITKVFLTFNELSLSQMQKGRFSEKPKEKKAACWERVPCRLNLSPLELQFSFPEWLTDNSWKESDIFSAAKQALQIKASA